MKPNASIKIPISGILKKTRRMPAKKQSEPLIFCFRMKKYNVLLNPMTSDNPERNKIYKL